VTDETLMIGKLLRQQAAIAAFGTFALQENDLSAVLNEAARACAKALKVSFAKICRYRVAENDLIIEAGYGWEKGVVGYVVTDLDGRTPQGRAFSTGLPIICNTIRNDEYFLPPFYVEHGIVSTIDVVIKGNDRPYGILEIDSTELQDYDQHDIDFLTGFANVLGEAVATSKRIDILAATITRMTDLMAEKDVLLDQKKVLAQELQHRVRNNLQLVCGMLSKQFDDTADEGGRRGLKAISRRVFTLAQVYDQLLATEMTRSIDLSAYLAALCANLSEAQESADGNVILRFQGRPLMLDLDAVTALGIIVAELVTNSFEHAFPDQNGSVSVSLSLEADANIATLTIRDNGTGCVLEAGSKRHGVGLVRRLTEQIRGTAKVESDNGTRWTIAFPVRTSMKDDDVERITKRA
jgi:two-component sensor histidine kinase